MPDSNGSVDLGSLSAEQQERLEKMAEENNTEPGAMDVAYAFVVIAHENGQIQVAAYDGPSFKSGRDFINDDVYGAAATIQKDIAAMESAQAVQHLMMEQARAAMQQQQAQQMTANLGDLRGGLRG